MTASEGASKVGPVLSKLQVPAMAVEWLREIYMSLIKTISSRKISVNTFFFYLVQHYYCPSFLVPQRS